MAAGSLVVYDLSPRAVVRLPLLMHQYRDLPMDMADASLVAIAEERRLRQVFTLDSDFGVYRLPNGATFELIPA